MFILKGIVCKGQMEIKIMCGARPWQKADLKFVSIINLGKNKERRRILISHNPHLMLIILKVTELWRLMEDFIRPRKIIFLLIGPDIIKKNK